MLEQIATGFGSFPVHEPPVAFQQNQTLSAASDDPVPTAISGLSIQFQPGAMVSAPLFYASASQANIQIPWELAGQTEVSISAAINGNKGKAQILKVSPFASGIFTVNGQGTGQGSIVDASYRIVDQSNPAQAGNVIQVFRTGLGAVTDPPKTGEAASSTKLSATTTTPTVSIGGIQDKVLFSGLAPGTVGEYQVNSQVPPGITAADSVPVRFQSVGAIQTQ